MDNPETIAICEKYGIKGYTINHDGSIDVDGHVNFNNRQLQSIPLKFRRVSGDFYCQNNQLNTLNNAPRDVDGSFYCNHNQLISLEGAPEEVGGNFYCNNNTLTNLINAPKKVGGHVDCRNNELPAEIIGNKEKIRAIIKIQDDFSIWNRDGSFNKKRFEYLMEEINGG